MRYITTATSFFVFLCFICSPILAGNLEASSATFYKCGHISFTDEQIQRALDEINIAIIKRKMNRIPYRGELYRSKRGYKLWPISRDGELVGPKEIHHDPFFILTQKNTKKVHVLALTYDKKFANCMKTKGISNSDLDSVGKKSNGYQCGDYFFSDQFIRTIVIEAKKPPSSHPSRRVGYPIVFNGPLYNSQMGLKMWPIIRREFAYKNVSPKPNTYFTLIDSNGNLFDVIIKMSDLNYIKCLRANKHVPDPLFTSTGDRRPASRYSGYICDKTFFDDISLRSHSEIFKEKTLHYENIYVKFEKLEYPFNTIGMVSYIDFGFYVTDTAGTEYFALLDLDFNVVKVGIEKSDGRVSYCKRYDNETKNHDQRNYKCSSSFYENYKLLQYIRFSWQEDQIGDPGSSMSKTRYEGSLFRPRNNFKIKIRHIPNSNGSSENHYIVINQKYELLGAIKETNGKFEKCEAL